MTLLPSLFEQRTPRVFEDMFDLLLTDKSNWGLTTMKVDIQETPTDYKIRADLPGFKKSEISVSLANQILTIACEHDQEKEQKEKDGNYILRERSYRSMQRSIPLSLSGSEENVRAEFKDGVLEINVKKSLEKQTKHIPVQ